MLLTEQGQARIHHIGVKTNAALLGDFCQRKVYPQTGTIGTM
jgi:hypothetical protein